MRSQVSKSVFHYSRVFLAREATSTNNFFSFVQDQHLYTWQIMEKVHVLPADILMKIRYISCKSFEVLRVVKSLLIFLRVSRANTI